VWGHRYPGERHEFSDLLLGALERALAAMAADEPDRVEPVIDLLATSELDVAQLLLYRTLAGNPERFAERGASYLLEDDRRLRCGYATDDYWVTRELLQVISPMLSETSFARLEEKLIWWAPGWERRKEARRYRGSAELRLLGGLQPGRLSETGRRRMQELGRKLGGEQPEPPQGIMAGGVSSPIPCDPARHMSDGQWLAAIDKHRQEWLEKHNLDLVGGAEELAATFEQLAKEQPERFTRLGLQIGPDSPAVYLERLLPALSQPQEDAEPASDEAVFALVRHVASLPDLPGARWIGGLVATRAPAEIPEDVLEIVVATAAHPDPEEDLWATEAPSGGDWYGGDPWSHGMDSVRGAGAEAIGRLVFARQERVGKLLGAVRALVADPVAAVRTCGAEALGGLMRWERSLAAELSVEMVEIDDRAVAARPVVDLLVAYIPTDWPIVEPTTERLLASEHEVARRAGAVLACLAALQVPDAATLLERCLTAEDEIVREATAGVLAANLSGARYAAVCADGLKRLFDDESSEVRQAAAQSISHMRGQQLGEHEELARALLRSRALAEGRSQLNLNPPFR